jgi:hypothetical protein
LHADRECDKIAVFRGAKPISNYSLNEILRDNWKYVCPKCVDDIIYEKIECQVVANENLKTVYDILRKEDYTPPAFNQFVKDMEDEENLRGTYSTLQKEGYIIPSFEDFMTDMGHDPEQSATQEVSYEKSNIKKLYDTLKSEGADVGTFEEFYDRCNTGGEQGLKNLRKLYEYLVSENYDVPDFENFVHTILEIDETSMSVIQDRKWLYNKMQSAGIDTGSYEDFKQSLSDKEDLNWYYDKCIELELNVGSYTEFIKKYAL